MQAIIVLMSPLAPLEYLIAEKAGMAFQQSAHHCSPGDFSAPQKQWEVQLIRSASFGRAFID